MFIEYPKQLQLYTYTNTHQMVIYFYFFFRAQRTPYVYVRMCATLTFAKMQVFNLLRKNTLKKYTVALFFFSARFVWQTCHVNCMFIRFWKYTNRHWQRHYRVWHLSTYPMGCFTADNWNTIISTSAMFFLRDSTFSRRLIRRGAKMNWQKWPAHLSLSKGS